MNSNRAAFAPLFCKIIRIVFAVICIGAMCYGILMLSLGLWEYHTLQTAKSAYTAVPVCVTSITPTDTSAHQDVITLEPIDAKAKEKLGATCTTSSQSTLQIGDILTMYYDSKHPQTRIVDFETTAKQLCIGGFLTALPVALGILMLILHRKKRKQRPPAVMICPEE